MWSHYPEPYRSVGWLYEYPDNDSIKYLVRFLEHLLHTSSKVGKFRVQRITFSEW